jgi:hypothetical protein
MSIYNYLLEKKLVENKKEFMNLHHSARAFKINGLIINDPTIEVKNGDRISIGLASFRVI